MIKFPTLGRGFLLCLLVGCTGYSTRPFNPAPEALVTIIPQSQMGIVSVTSDATEASWVIDGDEDSRWLAMGFPQEIILSLGGSHVVSGLRYSSGGWTPIAGYELFVSADLSDWGDPVASGERLSEEVTFTPKVGEFIRLRVVSGAQDYGYVAELNVLGQADGQSSTTRQPAPISGHTYYVATDGSDSSSGNDISTPFRTLQRALRAMSGGDTVYFRGGTYSGRGYSTGNGVVIPSGTSWDNATTISAYPGETVVLQPSVEQPFNYIICSIGLNAAAYTGASDQYIVIKDLILDGERCGGFSGIGMDNGTHHIRIENVEIKNFGNDVNGSAGIFTGDSHHIEVLGCDIHHMRGPDSLSGMAMYFTADDSLIEGNRFHDNTSDGIQVQNSAGTEGVYRTVVRNNRIYNNHSIGGIGAVDGQDNQIYNNVIYDNVGEGIIVSPVGNGAPSSDRNLIYNNTIYRNTGHCVGIGYWGPANGDRVINNLCYGNGSDDIDTFSSVTNIVEQTNLFGVEPPFVGVPDFHLRGVSPARGMGTNLSSMFGVDFDGAARPSGGAWTVGAFQ